MKTLPPERPITIDIHYRLVMTRDGARGLIRKLRTETSPGCKLIVSQIRRALAGKAGTTAALN